MVAFFMLFSLCACCGQVISRQAVVCVACYQDLPWSGLSSLSFATKEPDLFYAFEYAPPISHWIQALKFGQSLYLARVMAMLFISRLGFDTQADHIIPMPLHITRLRERGFNQAVELAKHVSAHIHLPLQQKTLIRTKATLAQATLMASVRKKNIKNAFKVCTNVADRNIVLFDDVMTTGATSQSAIKALNKAGARQVSIWCIARTGS